MRLTVRIVQTIALGLLAACGWPGTGAVTESGLCTSQEFRDAFLDGQQGVILDYTEPSRRLVEFGNTALPCLETIAEQGGAALGIEGCLETTQECRTWALDAIRAIGTAEARSYLLEFARHVPDEDLRVVAITALGSLKYEAARPFLRSVLAGTGPAETRAKAIVALGVIGNPEDVGAMLEALPTIPDPSLHTALHGFRVMEDERVLERLQQRIAAISQPEVRTTAEQWLESWRAAIAAQERILSTLRSGRGEDLYKAIQDAESESEETRAALFELLRNQDPRARAEAVVALGKMHVPGDFERLLEATLALPEPYVPLAARGLVHLNDVRAIGPLEEYAAGMQNLERQRLLLQLCERLRRSAEHLGQPGTGEDS